MNKDRYADEIAERARELGTALGYTQEEAAAAIKAALQGSVEPIQVFSLRLRWWQRPRWVYIKLWAWREARRQDQA